MISPLVPRPLHIENGAGFFSLSGATPIGSDSPDAQNAMQWFRDSLYELSGASLPVVKAKAPGAIWLQIQSDLTPESYALHIAQSGVEIRAADASGFFYGLATLLQCVPLECMTTGTQWNLPALEIEDAPRFGWRGIMLDSARHFQPVWWVKKFINAMALHKFNVLHWHLTDDQGWRVEIQKYPALASVSAWRQTSRVGHERGAGAADFDGRKPFSIAQIF